MTFLDELSEIADELDKLSAKLLPKEATLLNIKEKAELVGKSSSNSWVGYQASVYYNNFQAPPSDAVFSIQWGLGGYPDMGLCSRGDWRKYNPDDVINYIYQLAGISDLNKYEKGKNLIEEKLHYYKSTILSIISLQDENDILNDIKKDVEKCKPVILSHILHALKPPFKIVTNDMAALNGGIICPPHIIVIGKVHSILRTYEMCGQLAQLARKAASHIKRMNMADSYLNRVGNKIFIGHGQSPVWKDLKDFIHDRLHLPYDEFNRVPIAGKTNTDRLSEMLDDACFAFIIMTAEDETPKGGLQARMNVIHEVGLFQGRLGFDKAIVLLDDKCSEFSNIQGLGQIRFSSNHFSESFEEIRRVLEKHGIIKNG